MSGYAKIPDFKAFLGSKPDVVKEDIERLRDSIRRQIHERKLEYRAWAKRGLAKPVASYSFGPFDLPLDFFASTRWNERRTKLPLAKDEATWRIAWEYWRTAKSYQVIKASIEKHGMLRPVYADWYLNADLDLPVHGAFLFGMENPKWPQLLLRTGNERLMMAWFEWDWKTIPTVIVVRDCGRSQLISSLLRAVSDTGFIPRYSRNICRRVS